MSSAVPRTEISGPVAHTGLLSEGVRARTRTPWWLEALAIAWLLWLYDASTNLAPLRLHSALENARNLLAFERSLHLDPELALDRWLAGHHTLALIVSDYYDNAHFIVTLGLLGYLWLRRADLYRPLRNTLVLVNLLAFIVFWRWPVAPPRMLTSLGFKDVVATSHAFGSWHTGALASHANQLAAMPSLHMAWAAWCTLAVWRLSRRRWLRALALVYPCLTAIAVLATGNHFLLDIVGGLVTFAVAVLLVAAAGLLAARVRARRRRRSRRSQARGHEIALPGPRTRGPAYPSSQAVTRSASK